MGTFTKFKRRTAVIDLAIIGAVALFFAAGVFFEARRSDGQTPNIAPGVGASSPDSGDSAAESTPQPVTNPTATPESAPASTATPAPPVAAGTPNPEAVGQQVFLDIAGIENESVITESEVTITGTTTPDALVSINGQIVAVELDGSFSTTLSLDPGPNFVEIVSSNLRGQETSSVISVVSIQ